tara:strand:+ start:296 stop:424 length:129 start_codon:yes stop_codon:yes gene_type:complete
MSVFYHNVAASTEMALSNLEHIGLAAILLGTLVLVLSFLEKK